MIQLSALDIFEELRFVWELLLAEILFASCFTRRRQENIWLFPVGMIVFSLLAQIYVLYVLELTKRVFGIWIGVVNIAWYVLLSAMTVFWMYRCFEMTKADAIFLGAGAYSLQHMEYVVVNEVEAFVTNCFHNWYCMVCCVRLQRCFSIPFFIVYFA